MEAKGKLLLKTFGGIAVAAGLLLMFVGFYVMANAMSFDNMTPEVYEQSRRFMRLLQLSGIYLLGVGVVFGLAGFFGVMNCSNPEESEKCVKYGVLMTALSVISIIGLVCIANIITAVTICLAAAPMITAVLYLTGALLNYKQYKSNK